MYEDMSNTELHSLVENGAKEIERRRVVRDGPTLIEYAHWAPVTNLCIRYVTGLKRGQSDGDEEFKDALREEVLVTLYGPNFFDWLKEVAG
jgi:hypothetical protein